ncbi:MAG: ABC transporter permease [Caulobacteraceae bacterium]|nr:ABC transporter permease [Caulobacteraceae bacterium]
MSEAVASLGAVAAPSRSRRESVAQAIILSGPAIFLAAFCIMPLVLLVLLSVAHHDEGTLWAPAFELTQYRQLAEPTFLRVIGFSLFLAATSAVATLTIAFPAAYFISRMRRRAQVAWLVFILGALSLSEVLIVFAVQVLLSTSGVLVKTLVDLGVMASAHSLYPNFGAVLTCLVYLVLPYVVLFLYPAVSRLDEEMPQAAATMGASPIRTFFLVTMPLMRGPLVSAAALVVIFTISSYLTPLVLGRPETWTVGVHLSNTAMEAGDVPLAAAQAVLLVAAIIGLLALVRWIGRDRSARA